MLLRSATDRILTVDAWISYNPGPLRSNAKHVFLSQIQANQTGPGLFNIDGTVLPNVYFAGFSKKVASATVKSSIRLSSSVWLAGLDAAVGSDVC